MDWDVIRLFLHVLAATVWVGGQLTVAALVPTLRGLGADVARTVARRFAQIAWPAFVVLLVTGMWNIAAVDKGADTSAWRHTLTLKLVLVALSGVSAYVHGRATSRPAMAVFGALTGVTALAATFVGVQLSG